MEKNFTEGYARVVGEERLGQPEYYLAHHGVRKGKKTRVVFDAAAKYKGKALNDAILSGPALQAPLMAVILKFREGVVAWALDIGAMFSRIRMRPEDCRFFRFLWQRKGETRPYVCEFTRLPFGATCSPFLAISVTRRAAADYSQDPDALIAIKSKFYVDDYLSSVASVEQGVKEARAVSDALAKADLHLEGWVSNSPEFSQEMAVDGATTTELSLNGAEAEKMLGVCWKAQSDILTFQMDHITEVVYTRVGIASKVASLFEPQGMATPMVVKAKIKLRELGVQGLQWTDPVVGESRKWWEKWFDTLKQLNAVKIPRCLFPQELLIEETELHIFVDASKEAYAAVVYVRQIYRDGSIEIRQVRAVTKLAPKQNL
ncbi:uncharacterized protein LOC116918582 [Daphnia magna]|uniref:uncharacterized protein LOC116918582 n=1 Tax=Daphnia magna TaxID=35525 RepID=UPI001E1BBD4E|nr:uncharacterized protein LOC116918582 [Daphnia magna]